MKRWLAGLISGGLLWGTLPGQAAEGDLSQMVAQIRAATAQFLDVDQARKQGYRQMTRMIHLHGYHYFNPSITDFEITRPQMLLYVKDGDRWQLTGVEYVAGGPAPPHSFFPDAPWFQHKASCHYADGSEEEARSADLCPKVHPKTGASFEVWHPSLWSLHVWAWYPNPSGLFAETNPFLASYGGTQGLPGGGHEHGGWQRTPKQITFSEFNHNSSGFILVLVGILAVVEVFLPGRGWLKSLWPLSAIGLSLWVLARSDPQVWPMGPIPLWEGLTIPSVWQHKLLGLVMLAIGLIELLRRRGRLKHPAWGYPFPGLAIISGALLFAHGAHGKAQHLFAFITQQLVWGLSGFKIYLQHAALGLLAILIGGTKLLWDRNHAGSRGAGEQRSRDESMTSPPPPGSSAPQLIWRILMIAFGVLLIFYREM